MSVRASLGIAECRVQVTIPESDVNTTLRATIPGHAAEAQLISGPPEGESVRIRIEDVGRIIHVIEQTCPEAYREEFHWMGLWWAENALLQEDGDAGTPLALLPWMRFLCDQDLMEPGDVPKLARETGRRMRLLPQALDRFVFDPVLVEDGWGRALEAHDQDGSGGRTDSRGNDGVDVPAAGSGVGQDPPGGGRSSARLKGCCGHSFATAHCPFVREWADIAGTGLKSPASGFTWPGFCPE